MIDFSSLLNVDSHDSYVQAKWFAIQWSPNSISGEKINIGIGLLAKDGQRVVKTADSYNRLKCFYGDDDVRFHAEMACKIAEYEFSTIDSAKVREYRNHQISFSERGVIKTNDMAVSLHELFSEMVPIAVVDKKKVKKRK